MRVVVFTGNPFLEDSPWWRILVATPGLTAILVCRKIASSHPRDVARRFRRNVAKHGPLFVPYRVGVAIQGLLKRLFRRTKRALPAPISILMPVEVIDALDIHAPDVLERVRSFGADLGVSIGAPILRPSLFRLPQRGTINLHSGKVPDFRGAPPAFWELVHGATSIGATIHWMDEGLDTGAVISAAEAPIYAHDGLSDVEARAAELGALVLEDALHRLARGEAPARDQPPESGATHRFPTLGQRAALGWRMWRRRQRSNLAPRQLAKTAALAAATWLYRPFRDIGRTLRRRHPVRVFTFHRVTTLCRDGMTVAPEVFRRQIAYVAAHHDIVSVEHGIELVRSGARLRRPAAVITFDDGYRSVFKTARPIMSELGVAGCCFVCSDIVGTDRRFAHDADIPVSLWLDVMDWTELKMLRTEKWSIGTHTATHVRLSACTGEQLNYEIEEPRRAVRDRLGVAEPVLAYPFGLRDDISDEAIEIVRKAGHAVVLDDYSGEIPTGTTALVLGRIELGGDHETMAWMGHVHGLNIGRWRGLWKS